MWGWKRNKIAPIRNILRAFQINLWKRKSKLWKLILRGFFFFPFLNDFLVQVQHILEKTAVFGVLKAKFSNSDSSQ